MPDDRTPDRTDPPDDRQFGLSWLQNLGRDSLDPGYAEAAARRAHGHTRPAGRPVRMLRLGVAMVIAGVAIGVAVGNRQLNAPGDAAARAGAVQDVERAQDRERTLEEQVALLNADIRSRQSALGAVGPVETVASLQAVGALTPVTGPGLRVEIDPGKSVNVILDRDMQLLVNGLWESGAEAVAVGGVRLRPNTAIRQAGGAILVDNKPLFWPITVDAIGDPQTLEVNFLATTGHGRFTGFEANDGVGFDVEAAASLTVPGGSAPELRYAVAGTAAPTTTSTAPRPTR